MDEKESENPIKNVPLGDLKTEPEADALLDSPAMQPYVKLALAVMGHTDPAPSVAEITALPLEKRYTWRVASALKWAFADFENLNVVADRRTLSQEDLDKLVDLIRIRPLQFCMFLAALFGEQQMETIITGSVEQVKALRAKRRGQLGLERDLS